MNPTITISKFEVIGNQKTQLNFFENEYANACESKRFHELDNRLNYATQRIKAMDIFSSVDVQVKVLKEDVVNGHVDVGVSVKCMEKNVPALKAETFFGNDGNKVGANVQGRLRNLTGYGDIMKLTYGANSTGSKDAEITYSFPSVTKNRHSVDVETTFCDDNNRAKFASFRQNALSVAMHITSEDKSRKLSLQGLIRDELPVHEMFSTKTKADKYALSGPSSFSKNTQVSSKSAYQDPAFFGLLQGINSMTKSSSPTVLSLLSASTKLSVKYSQKKDTRDSASHPTNGQLLSTAFELALPPGSAQYVRTELSFEKHFPLFMDQKNNNNSIIGSVCCSLGTTRVLDFTSLGSVVNDDNAIHINSKGARKMCHMSDRYFLGGPLSVRGWNLCGIGPRALGASNVDNISDRRGSGGIVGDSLGGLTKMTSLIALSSHIPLPYEATKGVKALLFLNSAVLLPHAVFPLAFPSSSIISDLLSFTRVSVGTGLSYSLGPARIELSVAVPLIASPHDNLKTYQIGVSLGMNN